MLYLYLILAVVCGTVTAYVSLNFEGHYKSIIMQILLVASYVFTMLYGCEMGKDEVLHHPKDYIQRINGYYENNKFVATDTIFYKK